MILCFILFGCDQDDTIEVPWEAMKIAKVSGKRICYVVSGSEEENYNGRFCVEHEEKK